VSIEIKLYLKIFIKISIGFLDMDQLKKKLLFFDKLKNISLIFLTNSDFWYLMFGVFKQLNATSIDNIIFYLFK